MRLVRPFLCLPILASACIQEESYVGEAGFYSFAMTTDTPPFVMAEENALYILETRIELPITIPTPEELAELGMQAPAPFPRMPWVGRRDLVIEVDLSVTNLMDEEREVGVSLNGISEFHEYVPGFEIVDDEAVPNFNGWEHSLSLAPHETWQWTIQTEELDEVAVDLATIGNMAPNPNMIVYFENQSAHDERAQPYIPEVIPGLVGFRLGLFAFAASNIVVEASVRVLDDNSRLADPEDPMEWWELPAPAILMGPSGMAMP
jgi:hypothetical protein